MDAVSVLIPSQLRELAENLKNAKKTNALCVSLMHTTPGGLLNLVENDARTFNQKVTLATDKGYVIPGPSATPLLDAAARLPVALWHKDKLADFLLAADSNVIGPIQHLPFASTNNPPPALPATAILSFRSPAPRWWLQH